MENFFITLHSDSKSVYFENNPSNFKTKLPKRISLEGDWECGISEIFYKLKWYNIPKAQVFTVQYYFEQTMFGYPCILPPGFYSIDALVKQLNNSLLTINEKNYFPPHFDTIQEKLNTRMVIKYSVLSNNTMCTVELTDFLYDLLGFDKEKYESYIENIYNEYVVNENDAKRKDEAIKWKYNGDMQTEYIAENPIEISGGYHTLFVYCDNIKPHLVGDSNVSLLKYVGIPKNRKFGDMIHMTYPNTQYFPLLSNEFESIEIDIKDDSGERIPFLHGKTIIVLEFRKKQ